MEGKESKQGRRGCSTRNGVHPAGAYTNLMTNSRSGIRMGEWTGGQCPEPNQDILSSLGIFHGLNRMATASTASVAMATIRRPAHRGREARTLLEAFSRPTHFRGLYDLKHRIISRCSSRHVPPRRSDPPSGLYAFSRLASNPRSTLLQQRCLSAGGSRRAVDQFGSLHNGLRDETEPEFENSTSHSRVISRATMGMCWVSILSWTRIFHLL
jgi:hypothetical protein